MQWQHSYALGVDEIDAQHQCLLHHTLGVIKAVQDQRPWSDIYYQIEALRDYASFHFQFEEALMRMFGFPEKEEHAQSHTRFFSRLEEIERQAIQGQLERNVVQLLNDWFTEHILHSDRSYVEHLRQIPGIVLASGSTS